jgi:hypothetical protein
MPVTSTYKTGRAATVTIGSNTYTQAKVFDEPQETSAVITILHMGGLEKIADGPTDFGKIRVTIPEDGATRLTGASQNKDGQLVSIVYANGGGVSCTKAYCIADGGAKAQRGSSADRDLTFECLVACTWTAGS